MLKRAKAHLKQLRENDTDHMLQAIFCAYLAEPNDLDLRISLIGAMHQSNWLINRIQPYLEDWGVDNETWLTRCVRRHIRTPIGDPLATSSLLYFSPRAFFDAARLYFRTPVYGSIWNDGGDNYRVIFAAEWRSDGEGNRARRCFEVAWEAGADHLLEVHYATGITGEQGDYLHGMCSYSVVTTAHLPYRYWFTQARDVELDPLEKVRAAMKNLPSWVFG
jgi:hypothetical protein